MSLRCIRLIQQLNSRFSSLKLSQSNQLHQLAQKRATISHPSFVNCKYSTTITPTDKDQSKLKDGQSVDEPDNEVIEKQVKEEDREPLAENPKGKAKRERYAVNTYSHNPPGLMEFFDDPKNWGEEFVKSGKCYYCSFKRHPSNRPHSLNRSILESRRAAQQEQQ